MLKVAVVVVNWNAKEVTRNCLESLERSTYPDIDVILVDNASSDGSVEYLRALFPRVLLIANATNERFARGSNEGIRLGLERGAAYLFLLNNDAVVEETAIERLVGVVESSDRIGLVGSKILYFDHKHVIWSAGGEVNFWTGITRHRGIREEDRGQFDELADVGYLTGCALMASRKLVETIGVLDASYHMYGEDADWCLRAKRAGFRVVYVPDSRVWHKVSLSSGGEFSPGKVYQKTRSNILLFTRHARPYHWITIPFFSAVHLLWLFLTGISGRRAGVPGAVLRALRDGLLRREPR
ncbi:MAG: glycosyltransferase family 2 protein [Candidatus Eisenbacteria bacterium]